MSATEKTVRVLPADVYDALEFSATVYRGVGAFTSIDLLTDEPLCIAGHAEAVTDAMNMWDNPVGESLKSVGINAATNDQAVHRVNARRGVKNRNARIPFPKWCAELGVVRGV